MRKLIYTATLLLVSGSLTAAEAVDAGDTAWMLVATALVLMMTLPGLALFYGGLVRSKNVLSVLMHCFSMAAIMSLVWVVVGYSLAFAGDGAFIGNFDYVFLNHLAVDSLSGTIPETVFIVFQMTFFIITPALIAGAYAERIKFSVMVIFSVLWALICYTPICHMAWSEHGWFHSFGANGVMDFAGGTVVHINAGVAALVAALVLGKRLGYPQEPMKPHNLTMTITGAGLLWVGWFGFNAGSALAADGTAGMAMLTTQIASAAGAVTWMLIERLRQGKASALGIVSGAIAGLVAITPAAGNAGVPGALLLGVVSAAACYMAAVWLKAKLGYDDSLDAFGIHGIGGIVGAVLCALVAHPYFAGLAPGADYGWSAVFAQTLAQGGSVLVTALWSGIVSYVILKLLDVSIGLRVDEVAEQTGLDLSEHDERGYII